MEGLTGKTRYRLLKRSFGRTALLVIQVEITYVHVSNMAGMIDTETCTAWKDATIEDMQELGGFDEPRKPINV